MNENMTADDITQAINDSFNEWWADEGKRLSADVVSDPELLPALRRIASLAWFGGGIATLKARGVRP